MSIGNNIRRIRERRGLSQSEVARRLNVTAATVNQWESDTCNPRMGKIEQLASILQCSKVELVQDFDTNLSRLEYLYKNMSEEGRKALLAIAETFATTYPRNDDA